MLVLCKNNYLIIKLLLYFFFKEKTDKDKRNIKIKKKGSKKVRHPLNIIQSRFYDELKIAETEDVQISFDNLVEEISKQGKKFSKNPTFEELKIYKTMIFEFLKYVTNHMYQVEHYTSGNHIKQSSRFGCARIRQNLLQDCNRDFR